MRILAFFVVVGLLLLLFTTGTQLSSCTKETVIHDTVTIKDTITIKDTVTIIDSSCGACYDLNAGLVAYYNFNGGTLNDSSGFNNHIVSNNATKTTDRFGNPNSAYLFNGTSSYMRVAHHSSLNLGKTLTFSARVKLNGFYPGDCSVNQIFGKGATDNAPGFYFLRVSFYLGAPDCSTPTDITKEEFGAGIQDAGARTDTSYVKTNQWYDVVYTYDGQTSLLYVNGQLKHRATSSANPSQNTQDLYIGKHEHLPFPYWFNGVMDDIRIYDRALCEAEVKLLNKLKN